MSDPEKLKADPSCVAITLSTCYPKWYRGKLQSIKHTDKIRGDLAFELLHKANQLGYQVVVVDARSSRSFRKELSLLLRVKIVNRTSIKRSPAKRLAFKLASKLEGVRVIVYTDPEKVSFVSRCIPYVTNPIIEDRADIIVPKRNPELFKSTYPNYQFGSEMEGNRLYNEQLKMNNLQHPHDDELDMFFGPKVFRNEPNIVNLFMKRYSFYMNKNIKQAEDLIFDPEDYSNAIFFPIVIALKKKLRVASVEIPFSYPSIQKDNEEIGSSELFMEKRRAQRLSILVELMHLINLLEKKRYSRLR